MHIRVVALASMGLALFSGCASEAPSDRAEPEAIASDTAALTGNGQAQFVSQLESDVAAMAAVVGETGSFEPKSHGLPQRMAAIDAKLSAIQSDASALASASLSSSATLAQRQASYFTLNALLDLVTQVANDAKTKLNDMSAHREAISIGDMFSMQMLMNHLGQMAEMSSAVVDALNQAIIDMQRDVKGP